jgi:hypothetical protein
MTSGRPIDRPFLSLPVARARVLSWNDISEGMCSIFMLFLHATHMVFAYHPFQVFV